ncbi:hypothetical protein SAMN04488498_106217 [Mesorhizobium albiziae]|uniref:Uncharacterized protein n=1 Tax=Neomesorhizobium albiziae TaxID=335020 RepID=A0A1I3ZNA0_9HYPH|nr:hypothetical protein SAMN04488498_106217 [Mesorhizobium albiziae]
MTKRVIVGVTEASGSAVALETVRQLAKAGAETHLVVSHGEHATICHELGSDGLTRLSTNATSVHSPDSLTAPIASVPSGPTEWSCCLVPCDPWRRWHTALATTFSSAPPMSCSRKSAA